MKHSAILVLGAACACSASAHGGSGDFKKFLIAELPKTERAFDTLDIRYFIAGSTPDFTQSVGGRTLAKPQAMMGMKQQLVRYKTINTKLNILSASQKGNIGTALVHGTLTATTYPDRRGPSHQIVSEMWEKETWIRSGKGWLLKHIEETKPRTMTVDGKPFSRH